MFRANRLVLTVFSAALILAVIAVGRPSAPAAASWQDDGILLPVLMYHSIVDSPACWGPYVISPAELERDLEYLESGGYHTVTIQDLIDYIYNEAPLPEKPVMLTFDDGYYNNYLYAYPMLRKHGMRAVLSVVGKYTDRYSLSGDFHPEYAHVSWDQVREMSDSGVYEIQNHSYDLHTINQDRTASMKVSSESAEHYRTVLVSDAVRMQALIDSNTGRLPTVYTYPYGLISNESIAILKDLGFRATLSCSTGINWIIKDPKCLYLLKRILRPHGKPASSILAAQTKPPSR